MDNLADERSLPCPTLWTHLTSGVAAWFGERLIGRPKRGAVTNTFPTGRSKTFGRPGTGEHPRLIVHNISMNPETLRRGTVGFANAYMRGDVEVDDLTALFRYFLQNRNEFQPKGAGWFGRAPQDIAYHLSRASTPNTAPWPMPPGQGRRQRARNRLRLGRLRRDGGQGLRRLSLWHHAEPRAARLRPAAHPEAGPRQPSDHPYR